MSRRHAARPQGQVDTVNDPMASPQVGLPDVLGVAQSELRALVEAWQVAVNVWQLGYGPAGIDYAPRAKVSVGVDRPVPVRLDGKDGIAPPSALSAAHAASVRQLRHAVVAASELSWVPDDVAQVAVLPEERIGDVRSTPVSHARGMAMAREVNLAVIGAVWRLEGPHWRFYTQPDVYGPQRQWVVPPRLTEADGPFLRTLAEQVTAALLCLPDELYVEPAVRKVRPSHRECPGYVFHLCGKLIPFDSKRCGECQTAADRIRELSHGEHADVCRNPWGRSACRGDVSSGRWGLCVSCDQYRRDGARKAG